MIQTKRKFMSVLKSARRASTQLSWSEWQTALTASKRSPEH